MTRIDIVESEEAPDETTARLLEEAREGWYGDAAFFGAMAHRPVLFERVVSLFEAFARERGIEASTLELVRLRVAATNHCAYCATVRTQSVAAEVAPKESAVLGERLDVESLTRRERLAVRLADGVSDAPHDITDELVDDLREEFGDEGFVELLLFASLEVGLDRFCIALELDTTEESAYPTGLDYPFRPGDGE
ncbi:carboxymuconolactone decarboxylase family protein [Halomarina ordinaria]|uniref:Carboxymuconolactone decarboxylase family protein n=1 Tax=Halomarina ordinaria TaxID=3033939 RepID=A0ABD5U8I4_9EURY|nr:carboxymuconolactone decarboxylase family protein [Halomarina sp. PSRA2]